MKIQYLNPENAPTPPDGWRYATPLCKPVNNDQWKLWDCPRVGYTTFHGSSGPYYPIHTFTFITQADLPADYYFDLDGTGLSFDDPFYRRGVEKAAKEGKTIQNLRTDGQWVDCISPAHYFAVDACLRIHPRHAPDYGLVVPGDKEPTIPANLPPLPISPKPGHHWEYRGTRWESKETKIIAYCSLDGSGAWDVENGLAGGIAFHYAELVPDAPTGQPVMGNPMTEKPDLDSPDYWRERQDEVFAEWVKSGGKMLQIYNFASKKFFDDPESEKRVYHTATYRPRPVALTDEQRDERDFEEWLRVLGIMPSHQAQMLYREGFLAGRRTLREQQKGGAK